MSRPRGLHEVGKIIIKIIMMLYAEISEASFLIRGVCLLGVLAACILSFYLHVCCLKILLLLLALLLQTLLFLLLVVIIADLVLENAGSSGGGTSSGCSCCSGGQ